MSDSLQHHGLKQTRLPCPSPTPRACSNSSPSNWWCHPIISFSVVPFSHLQSFPVSGSFPMSQFFTSGGQSIGVWAWASVLPMNIQNWFSLGWIDWISLLQLHGVQYARLPCLSQFPRVFSNSCSLSQWCHPTISSSVVPLSSCLQSLPTSGSWFSVCGPFASGGKIIGASTSASVLPTNIYNWFI